MSVTECAELHQRSFEIDKHYQAKHTRSFRLITNNDTDDGITAVNDAIANHGLPSIWSVHPNDPSAYCSNVSVNAESGDEDSIEWLVVLTYETGVFGENPLTALPVPEWDYSDVEIPIDYDINNKAIKNTAGVPLDPPITIEVGMAILTVKRNEIISPSVWNLFKNATNAGVFQGYPPYACRYMGCKGSVQYWTNPDTNASEFYWENVHVFSFCTLPKGWRKVVVSSGFQELVDNKLKDILIQGQPATTPQLLDAEGAAVTPGPTATPYFMTFDVYNSIDFSVFGLGVY